MMARAELHNITYIATVDGVAPGALATFRINDNETSSTNLSSMPGNTFQANEVLSDPAKAGMQVWSRGRVRQMRIARSTSTTRSQRKSTARSRSHWATMTPTG